MLAEQDGIEAWDAPTAALPPNMAPTRPSLMGGASENRAHLPGGAHHRSSRTSKVRSNAQAVHAPSSSPGHYAADEVEAASALTSATLPAVRNSVASTVGPFGHSTGTTSSSIPPATKQAKQASSKKTSKDSATTSQKKAKTRGSSSASRGSTASAKGANKKPPTAPSAKKTPTKPKSAKGAGPATKSGSVRSGASRASSASAQTRKSKDGVSTASTQKKKKKSVKPKSATAGAAAAAAKTKKAPPSRAGSTATSKKSSTVVRRGAPMKKGHASSRASTSRSSLNSNAKANSRGGSAGKRRRTTKINIRSLLDAVVEQEVDARHAIEVEEEMERDGLQPVYNVVVMELVRTQVQQLNRRQRQFTETMELLKERGLRQSHLEGAENTEELIDLLKDRLEGDARQEAQQLRAENASLRERLDERTFEADKKSSEMELLRTQLARQLTRGEVEKDAMRAEVQSSLQSASLDVERMKKELGHRIDIACSSFRTPKYDTAMRAMQDLVAEVQRAVQEHHDTLSKLILSIGAKDTFAKEEGDSMHTNLPAKYRASLRALEKDNILNILDVLSFQDGVVTTIGKALYVLEETGHKTSVM